MNLGKNFLGFLGSSLSASLKLIGETTTFAKRPLEDLVGLKVVGMDVVILECVGVHSVVGVEVE